MMRVNLKLPHLLYPVQKIQIMSISHSFNNLKNLQKACGYFCSDKVLQKQNKPLLYYDASNNHNGMFISRSYHALGQSSLLNYNLHKSHRTIKDGQTSRDISTAEFFKEIAVTQSTWFQALSKSTIVQHMMSNLQLFHDTSHLPWWVTIVASTVMLRLVFTLPLAIYQAYIFAKVEIVGQELSKLMPRLKGETDYAVKKFKWDQKHANFMFRKSVRKLRNNLILQHNCHPFKASLLIWFQLPLWVTLSMSLRNLTTMMPLQDSVAQITFLEMSVGGFGWIPNLTVPDASLILPVAMTALTLINIEIGVMNRDKTTKIQRILTNTFRGISLIFIPIGMNLPSGVTLYWTMSSFYSVVQNLILLHPKLRQLCRIPQTPSQRERPYQHLRDRLKDRLRL